MGLLNIPGTTIPFNSLLSGANLIFEQMIEAAGGLSLSQVCSITGLEGSTIQNWIKRGFVSKPVNKKYYNRQLFRILIIGVLRDSMQIEQIVSLLKVVNRMVSNGQDDIIGDEKLFNYLCAAIRSLDIENGINKEKIEDDIADIIKDYSNKNNRICKLKEVLSIMTYGYITSLLKNKTDMMYSEFMTKQGEF